MITWRDLYFPPKIIALIVATLSITLTLYFTTKYVKSALTITATPSEAYAWMNDASLPDPLPQTFFVRPGKVTYYIASPGYIGKKIDLLLWPFRSKSVNVALMKDISITTNQFTISYLYNLDKYEIRPNIVLNPNIAQSTQIAAQWETYNQDGLAALAYIRSTGLDPRNLPIVWWHRELWPPGKTIML